MVERAVILGGLGGVMLLGACAGGAGPGASRPTGGTEVAVTVAPAAASTAASTAAADSPADAVEEGETEEKEYEVIGLVNPGAVGSADLPWGRLDALGKAPDGRDEALGAVLERGMAISRDATIVPDDGMTGTGSVGTLSGGMRPAGGQRARAKVTVGEVAVQGRLPTEVVRRILRLTLGPSRVCHEKGLEKNAALRGSVSVKFVISQDGSVTSASKTASDLADADVVKCIVATFRGLSFPQPEGGVVVVDHRLSFAPATEVATAGTSSPKAAPDAPKAPSPPPAAK